MPGRPLSVQLYSVRDAVADDLEGAVARIAGLGFRAVEPYGYVDQAERYRAAFDANGLTAPSAHAPVLQMADPAKAFDAAAAMGTGIVIDPFHAPDGWAAVDEVRRTADRLNALSAEAQRAGLTFGYHNHWFELEGGLEGVTPLELLAQHLDPAVVLEVDTYWVEVAGVRAPDLLRRLGDRVGLIHVKDGPRTRDTAAQQPAGSGSMDVPAVLAAAPDAIRVLEFDDYAGDVFDGLAASLAAVTAMDAEVVR